LPLKKWKLKDTAEWEPSSELEVFKKKSKGKAKHLQSGARLSSITSVSPKHHHGQPYKATKHPQSCNFSTHVFVEIANPLKLHWGKTHRTNRYVLQGPTTEGPFTITHQTSWKSFMSQVVELAELEEDSIVLTQMTWHF
jgi:hypothetical protein